MRHPDPIARLLEQARAQLNEGRPDVAALLYRTLLVVRPDLPEALAGLAEAERPPVAVEGGPAAATDAPGDAPTDNAGDAASDPLLAEKRRVAGLFVAGDLAGVEASARRMTIAHPDDAFGWKLLGAALQHLGRAQESLAANGRAAELAPNDAEALFNLGAAQQKLLLLDDAEASYRRALDIKPDFAEAASNLGNVYAARGRRAEAELCYRAALDADPRHAAAANNLGVTLHDLGRLTDAETFLRRALRLRPDYAEALGNLGNLLRDMGRLTEAETCLRRAVTVRPDMAQSWCNLGVVLHGQRRLEEALECLERARALWPHGAEILNNLGNVLLDQGQTTEAEDAFRAAIAAAPRFARAHGNLGVALGSQGRTAEALACFRAARELAPDNAEAASNLGAQLRELGHITEAIELCRDAVECDPMFAAAHNNLGAALKDAGRLAEAEDCFREAVRLAPEDFAARSNLLYSLLYDGPPAAPERLATSREFGLAATRAAGAPCVDWPEAARLAQAGAPLRVGLVSADLRSHAVAYFLESVLGRMDPTRLEFFAYPNGSAAGDDPVAARLRGRVAAWRPLPPDDAAAAKIIRDDGAQVLIDLSGHTAGNRLPLFARRPAPAQASWLGFPGGTGLAEMDCLIADGSLPRDMEAEYTEIVLRLPGCRLCFTPPEDEAPAVAPSPATANGYVTFCCCNDLAKLNDGVLALWARVLAAVPTSRLLLRAGQLADTALREEFAARLAALGVDPERVDLEGPLPRAEYLAAHARADIALDPFPYPGGATSAESLWMGVPVLTLAGRGLLAGQGASIAAAAGLPDWIARDADDYVRLAAERAGDFPALARLRADLRGRVAASALCDAGGFARDLTDVIEAAWRRFGLPRLVAH